MLSKPFFKLIICFILFFVGRLYAQEVYMLVEKADSLFNIAKYEDASKMFENILSDEINIEELGNDKITELHHFAGLACYYCKQYSKSIYHFEQIIALNKDSDNQKLMASCYNNMGMVFYTWQRTDKAIECYQKAIDLLVAVDDKSQTSTIYTNIGLLYNSINNHPKAIDYFIQALVIDKALNHPTDIATDLNNIGIAYKSMEQFKLAIDFFKQGIDIYQTLDKNDIYFKLLKNTVISYSTIGRNDSALFYINLINENISPAATIENETDINFLLAAGDVFFKSELFDKANSYYTKALKLSTNNKEPINVCFSLKRLGNVAFSKSEYKKAIQYYNLSLESELNSGSFVDAITTYQQIGDMYLFCNNYDSALVCYQNAYSISQKIKNDDFTALAFNNIGKVYINWGQYDKAIAFFNDALKNAENNKNENDIAESYLHIGLVNKVWGKYDEAIAYFLKSLNICSIHNLTDKMAIINNNIGLCFQKKGEIDQAFEYFSKAIDLAQQSKNNNIIAACLTNMGFYYKCIGNTDKALENFKQALDIDIKIKKDDNIASDYNNIGTIYLSNNDFIKAQEYFSKALFIDSSLHKEADIAIDENNLGASYIGMNQFENAIFYLSRAIDIKEKLRKTAIGEIRREYFQSQINTYSDLIFAYLSIQDIPNAFQTIELTKAKLLAERISKSDTNIVISSLADIQSKLDEKTAIIVYATSTREDLTIMFITKNKVLTQKNNKKAFTERVLKSFDVDLKSYIYDQLSENVRNNQQLLNAEIKSRKHELESIIQYYRKLLLIANPNNETKQKTILLSNMLFNFLIAPITPYLNNINTLIIEPDGILGLLPFETLINDKNEYLVLEKDISYTPSLSILSLIKSRNYSPNRNFLLAIGGGIYNKDTYQSDMKLSDILLNSDSLDYTISKGMLAKYLNEEQIKYLQKQTTEAIQKNTSLKSIYEALGYANWSNLPGSLVEVRVLAKLFKNVDTLTAYDVKESKIKTLSKSGKLMNYKTIHFSTHGIGIPEIPELSAIILNPDDNSIEDGYLRMGEISELKFNADFVNLSACETGLGKVYAGEGVVGLTQSFLIAGANGVSASLWKVSDQSTAQFMIDVFSFVKKENLTYIQAINKTKRLYIEGIHSDKWKSPYFWAPFVYYGN